MHAWRWIGSALGGAAVILLLVSPAGAQGPLWSVTFSAPFVGFSAHPDRAATAVGCAGSAYGRELVKPTFNATTGAVQLGTVSSTGCASNTGTAWANSSEVLLLRTPSFSPSVTASYWVNVSWNLSFSFTFKSNFVNSSDEGISSYAIHLDVSLVDLTTNVARTVGPHYLNSTTAAGCCSVPITYTGVLVHFSSHLRLVTTDSYAVRIKLSESVFSTAIGSAGRAKTSLLIGLSGNPATLGTVSLQ